VSGREKLKNMAVETDFSCTRCKKANRLKFLNCVLGQQLKLSSNSCEQRVMVIFRDTLLTAVSVSPLWLTIPSLATVLNWVSCYFKLGGIRRRGG
jgi:hypothetical protein